MRKIVMCLLTLSLTIPMISNATWQVANTDRHGFSSRIGNPHTGKTDYPMQYENGSRFSFSIRKGTLLTNVSRLAKNYGWAVNWYAPHNYPVLLNTKIVGHSFPVTMNRLLDNYPLRVTYNTQTKTMNVFQKTTTRRYSK